MLVAVVLTGGCAGKKRLVPSDKLWSEGNSAFHDEAWEVAVANPVKPTGMRTVLDTVWGTPNNCLASAVSYGATDAEA